jgi:cytochrome b561
MIQYGALYNISGVLAASLYLIFIALVLQGLVYLIERQKDWIVSFVAISKQNRNLV